jgi:hypothetical protein
MIGWISDLKPIRAARRRVGTARRKEAVNAMFNCQALNWDALPRVAVAPRSHILYNRVQKNANSSLIILMYWLETGRTLGAVRARRSVSHLDDWPVRKMVYLANFSRMVVVRDPFSRTLSAFLNKVDTQRFRADVGHMQATPECFSQFLRWLDDGGMGVNSHWDLQTKQLLFPIERYTDVIRFERLEDELAGFFERRGVDPDYMHRSGAFQRGRAHRTDANDRFHQFYDAEGTEIVQRLFANDFKALGYDPNLAR